VANAVDWMFGQAGSWLPVVLFFPLATFSAGRLVGGSVVARVSAGLLYAVNPFVFDRLYAGQIPLLIGYALLPLATRSLIRTAANRGFWPAGLWVGALMAFSVQFAWILAVVALAALLVQLSGSLRSLARLAAAGALGGAMSLYAIVGLMIAGGNLQAPLGQLAAYRTSSDPRFGLFINVAGLYGFWRPGPTYAKNLLSGWPFLLLGILIVVTVGLTAKIRKPPGRRIAICLLISGIAGYFLTLGSQGPTGALYRYAYVHVPGFQMLREPEKFSMLVALCYACGFGWGVDRLVGEARTRGRSVAIGALVIALPCVYTPNLVAGLGGQVQASTYPASWQTVARIVRGSALVLFLPWHEYQALPFAANRIVSTPAVQYFPAPILSNEDAGSRYQLGPVDPEDRFVSSVIAHGRSVSDVGSLLAAIGVRWIVLAKINDWHSYGWLVHQHDLHLVFHSNDVDVLRNRALPAVPLRISALRSVTSLQTLVTTDGKSAIGRVFGLNAKRPGVTTTRRPIVAVAVSLRKVYPVAYHVGPGGRGWFVLPIPYERGWSLDGRPAVPLATGNLAVPANQRGELHFDNWPLIFLSEIASLAATLIGVVATTRGRRRGASVGPRGRPSR